jgi:hypothetical protein
MVNDQLLLYVRTQVAKGTPLEIIKSDLTSEGGWSVEDVDEAFQALHITRRQVTPEAFVPSQNGSVSPLPPSPPTPTPPPPPEPTPITAPPPPEPTTPLPPPPLVPPTPPDIASATPPLVPSPSDFNLNQPISEPSFVPPPPPIIATDASVAEAMYASGSSTKTKLILAVAGLVILAIIVSVLTLTFMNMKKSVLPISTYQSPFGTSTSDSVATSTVGMTNEVSTTQASTTTATSTKSSTQCNNYSCLIHAASTCTPISATIDYSVANFIVPGTIQSGQTNYVIKKSSGINNCTLVMTYISSVIKVTDAGRSEMIASGLTNSEIDAQLKIMNTALAQATGQATTCASNAKTITAYLTDQNNHNTIEGTFTVNSSGQTVSKYKTSSGLVISCLGVATSSFTPAAGLKTN